MIQEVLEVAQNILAFLKANCTREGHTYWLFRQRGEEVVKLYDITSLMETSSRVRRGRGGGGGGGGGGGRVTEKGENLHVLWCVCCRTRKKEERLRIHLPDQ